MAEREPDELTWRAVLRDAARQLAAAGRHNGEAEARWMVEAASGYEGAELHEVLDRPPTRRTLAHLDAMVARRLAGEPLQYVLGSWQFRTLDLAVDRRALIPRPETEVVVEVALAELDRRTPARTAAGGLVAADLGTGTGAIALALVAERPWVTVWATDVDGGALDLARANLAGAGRSATRVRLAGGSWFEALPADLRGRLDLVVSNPPYVGAGEDLPDEVAAWEPRGALVPGPTGLEAIEVLLADVGAWLAPGGAVVLEHAPRQADVVVRLARDHGLVDAVVLADLSGRPRALRARRPA